MRILVVSAHYPPDFVSGGTLMPQRIARGLRARGHAVSVYAGNINETREPLETWADVDETGIAIRWVAIRPFTPWHLRRNFDNPDVTADFADHVRRLRPDVVHIHSVQGLGAPIVGAAKAAGARVVVTMHDFWWLCSRQFLADLEPRPCSLVVEAGNCRCEVDHPWLVRRNRRLSTELAAADLLLAPSESAAAVMIANGLAGVEVDENGLPPWEPAPRPPRPDGPLRLLYTGGWNPLKGWRVLVEALAWLPESGWTLDAYGVSMSAEWPLDPARSANVRLRSPYAPGELAAILASHDVLIVPSVMRETQSIVTREALQAGLAVVATDSLGPEEVVTDHVNGRIVPAAEPGDLGRALTDLIAHPEAASVAPGGPSLRSVDDQVAGLEQRYEALLVAPPTPPPPRPARILFVVGLDGAPTRYRAHLPAEALRLAGVHVDVCHYRDRRVPGLAKRADVVVLYRVPATHELLALIAELRAASRPPLLVGDIDDLIFDPTLRGTLGNLDNLSEAEESLWWQGVRRYRTTLEQVDLFVTTTPVLAERAETLMGLPSGVLPNGVGLVLARRSDLAVNRPRSPGPVRIGYFSGTDTHDADWAEVESVVVEVLHERPEVELWLGGHLRTGQALRSLGGRVHRLPFLPWRELPAVLRDLDVNLAPLELGPVFNEAKSAIKWLEAALVQTPTVATPTAPFRAVIEEGRNGRLAADAAGWRTALLELIDDQVLRDRIGARARRDALVSFAPALQAQRYLDLLAAAHDRRAVHGPRQPSADWQAELVSEPWEVRGLEQYDDLADPVQDLREAAIRLRRLAGRTLLRARPYAAAARARARSL